MKLALSVTVRGRHDAGRVIELPRRAGALAAAGFLLAILSGCMQQPVPPSAVAPPAPPAASPSLAAERPPACTEVGQRWISPKDGVTLVCVPAGSFFMGAAADDPHATGANTPRHLVRLSAYWIDRTEVTNADFEQCVLAGLCPPRSKKPGTTGVASKTQLDYYHDPVYADYPVLLYTPEEAAAYCSCMGRRLPTEAEFERAADGTQAHAYPWNDTLDCAHASYLDCTRDTTDVETPAAGASSFGALNMAGNVWEWVSDWYSENGYATSPIDDPTGPLTGEFKVRRGGGFSSLGRDLLVIARASGNPAHYFDGQMGVRCAMSAAS